MSREREWKLYFDDLFGFCEKVICYTDGLTKENIEASVRALRKHARKGD
jgi:uncharacterized protein with HEPN domain